MGYQSKLSIFLIKSYTACTKITIKGMWPFQCCFHELPLFLSIFYKQNFVCWRVSVKQGKYLDIVHGYQGRNKVEGDAGHLPRVSVRANERGTEKEKER